MKNTFLTKNSKDVAAARAHVRWRPWRPWRMQCLFAARALEADNSLTAHIAGKGLHK
jgi:hypothetical protein